MGAPGPAAVIYLKVPPVCGLPVLAGEEVVGVAEDVVPGVVVLGVVAAGVALVGEEAAGVLLAGEVVAGVVVLEVPLLQPAMIKTLISKIAKGINNFFTLSSMLFNTWLRPVIYLTDGVVLKIKRPISGEKQVQGGASYPQKSTGSRGLIADPVLNHHPATFIHSIQSTQRLSDTVIIISRAYRYVKQMQVKKFLSKLVANAIATFGEAPLDVEVRTTNAAGAAFQTALVSHGNTITFQAVNIGRTKIQALLMLAFPASIAVLDSQMTFFIHFKSIEK